jgi:membrane dipeptidase
MADKFPPLLEELARRGWKDEELAKVAGANLLSVLRATEAVSNRLRDTPAASAAR